MLVQTVQRDTFWCLWLLPQAEEWSPLQHTPDVMMNDYDDWKCSPKILENVSRMGIFSFPTHCFNCMAQLRLLKLSSKIGMKFPKGREYKYQIVFLLLWEHPLGWHWCWWRKRSFRKPWDLPWTAFLPSTDSPPQASAKQHHNPESYILKANSHSSLVWVEPFFLFRYKLPNFWW